MVPNATVLVVDDDPTMVRLVQMHLELEGYRVLTASDGEECVSQTRKHQPDIIVMDVMMPKLDGVAATKMLKADGETKGVPIILLSAKTAAPDVARGLEAGADKYMAKPFDTKALFDCIAALLSKTP